MSKLKRSMAVSILFVFALALFSGIFTIPMIKTVHANPGWALQYSLPSSTPLRGIWGSSSTDVFAVGQTGTYPNFTGTIFHYDSAAWTQMAIGTTRPLYGIWGSSSTDVFAVGDSGTILHYNGTAWSTINSGTSNWLQGIWGSSSTDIFVAGAETILHYNGISWSRYNVSGINLQGIWGSSSTDVFAVGMSGTILHYNGISWITMNSNYTGWIRGIWGSSSTDVFAVGDSGTILHYNGTAWSKMTSGITNNLRGIWGSSSTDVFAVGDSGTILHYNGIGWSSMSFPSDTLYSIWGNSSANIFAVGASRILHYQPTDTFTVTYDANGGSNTPTDSNSPYNDGATVTVLGTGGMTRTGYTFSKWNTQADGSGTDYLPGATFTIRKNMILYAKWTINTYTVTFDSQGGSAVAPLTNVSYGSTISAPADPTRTGYTFAGWYKDAACTNAWVFATDTVTDNITLYAKWTINTYTLSTSQVGEGTVSKNPSQETYDYGTSVELTATPSLGWHFVSWSGDDVPSGHETDNPLTIIMDANKTVTATFSNKYYITASVNNTNYGNISPSGSVEVTQGTDQPFTITPNTGCFLKQVLVDGVIVFPAGMGSDNEVPSSYTYTFKNVQSNHTIHAVFAPGFLQYVITASAGTGGAISPSGDVSVPQFGSQIFTITPNTGYHILDVKVDGTSVFDELVDNKYTFENVDTNHTIKAYFEHNYIKTTYPLGTEVFSPTSTIHVTWNVEGFTETEGKVRIFFYNGSTWSLVASNLDLADGSFDLDLTGKTISDPLRCRVRVGIYDPNTGAWLTWGTNGQYYDESGHFWVIDPSPTKYLKTAYPIGSEVFLPTDTINVTWNVEGFTETEGKVRIFFYNGSTWSLVASNLDLADGSFDLDLTGKTISDPLRCRVRVGIYDPNTGAWLTWGTNGQYYDESGHFWVIEQELPPLR